jgi:hypothetical protein
LIAELLLIEGDKGGSLALTVVGFGRRGDWLPRRRLDWCSGWTSHGESRGREVEVGWTWEEGTERGTEGESRESDTLSLIPL